MPKYKINITPDLSEIVEADSIEDAKKIVAVGDVCVSALRKSGIIPDISVIDGRTKDKIYLKN